MTKRQSTFREVVLNATIKSVCSAVAKVRGGEITYMLEMRLSRVPGTSDVQYTFQPEHVAIMNNADMPRRGNGTRELMLQALIQALEESTERYRRELAKEQAVTVAGQN
jgi:hypothetical protein